MASPTDVAGLVRRWRADSIAQAAGSAVASWPALAGGAALAQATAASQPTYQTNVVNGQPVVRFDGSNDSLAVTGGIAQAQPATVAFVVRLAVSGQQQLFLATTSQLWSNGTPWAINLGGTSLTGGTTNTAWHVITATLAATATVFDNGTQIISGSSGTVGIDGSRFQVGQFTSGRNLNGDIAEILVYDHALSAGERATVHSYVQDRYGITVSDYVPPAGGGATVAGATATATATAPAGTVVVGGGATVAGVTATATGKANPGTAVGSGPPPPPPPPPVTLVGWFSPAGRTALARSHTAVSRVEVLHSGQPVYTLDVVAGSVTAEADRPVMRNLSATLVDPTGALTGGDVDDLLNPYDCEVRPWRGLLIPGGGPLPSLGIELAPLGVFGLTSRKVSGDGSIEIAGQDRAMNYQGPMDAALGVSGGTPVEEAILRLLAARNPGLSLLTLRTGFTVGPLVFAPDIDVWREAQKLAESVGGRLFHDRQGQCVFTLAGPTTSTPVATWAEGDGLLLGVDRQEDSDTIRNVVIAESTDGAIRVVVEDSNPASPTWAGGRYGRRPVTLTSQYYGSAQQAQQAAASRLAYELGRSETVTFTAVPRPDLDPTDIVTVHRPRAGLTWRGLEVASVDMPLAADQEMQVGCRKNVLAPDGRVFPADREPAA